MTREQLIQDILDEAQQVPKSYLPGLLEHIKMYTTQCRQEISNHSKLLYINEPVGLRGRTLSDNELFSLLRKSAESKPLSPEQLHEYL